MTEIQMSGHQIANIACELIKSQDFSGYDKFIKSLSEEEFSSYQSRIKEIAEKTEK
jgi:hypothetical protein